MPTRRTGRPARSRSISAARRATPSASCACVRTISETLCARAPPGL